MPENKQEICRKKWIRLCRKTVDEISNIDWDTPFFSEGEPKWVVEMAKIRIGLRDLVIREERNNGDKT
jgi:hypothetical protein